SLKTDITGVAAFNMSSNVKLRYFKKHLKWLKILGIDIEPVENVWYARIYRAYAVTLLSYLYLYSFLELIDIIQSPDFNSMTFGLSYFVTHIIGGAKITILALKKTRFRQMFLKLESGFFAPNMERGGDEEFRLVKAAVRRTNIHADLFNTFVWLIIGIRVLYAVFDKGAVATYYDKGLNITVSRQIRTLPYKAWSPVDLNESPAYEIMFAIQTSCLLLYGFYIGFLDSIVYGMMIHMNTQYLLLRHLLSRYVSIAKKIALNNRENVQDELSESIKLPEGIEKTIILGGPLQKIIKRIVHYSAEYHIEILKYCDQIESEFSYLMLLQFLCSLYILCFQLYQLSLVTNYLSFDSISMCLYLFLMSYQLICYCWYGNEVVVQSSEFSSYLNNTEWLSFNDSTRKSLLLMMMRSQRPTIFTAGKFAILSMETYITVGAFGK
ncbi:hypothetical protein NQ318_004640, partial [Aromia moschata]